MSTHTPSARRAAIVFLGALALSLVALTQVSGNSPAGAQTPSSTTNTTVPPNVILASVTAAPTTDLAPGDVVRIRIGSTVNATGYISAGICTGPVGGTGPIAAEGFGHTCTRMSSTYLVDGVATLDYPAARGSFTFTSPAGGTYTVKCDPSSPCWLGVSVAGASGALVRSFQLTFRADGTTTIPSTTSSSTTTTTSSTTTVPTTTTAPTTTVTDWCALKEQLPNWLWRLIKRLLHVNCTKPVPSTTIPSTTVPSTTVPSTTVPSTTIPSTTQTSFITTTTGVFGDLFGFEGYVRLVTCDGTPAAPANCSAPVGTQGRAIAVDTGRSFATASNGFYEAGGFFGTTRFRAEVAWPPGRILDCPVYSANPSGGGLSGTHLDLDCFSFPAV